VAGVIALSATRPASASARLASSTTPATVSVAGEIEEAGIAKGDRGGVTGGERPVEGQQQGGEGGLFEDRVGSLWTANSVPSDR
jgi:hypothetical protein